MDLDNRVSVLETEVKAVKDDISSIRNQISLTATKKDVDDLKDFFGERDQKWLDLLTWVIKTLVVMVGIILLASYGIEKIPAIFGG